MRISELNVYPVKSLGGIRLEHATLGVRGLAFDRHWMVVDQVGRFVTQRQLPGMARISVRLEHQRQQFEPHLAGAMQRGLGISTRHLP